MGVCAAGEHVCRSLSQHATTGRPVGLLHSCQVLLVRREVVSCTGRLANAGCWPYVLVRVQAAVALRARAGFIYIRGEFVNERQAVLRAIDEAYKAGWVLCVSRAT